MKKYSKPSITRLSFAQKESIARDCRFCYEGYLYDNCPSGTECWGGEGSCIADDDPYGVA